MKQYFLNAADILLKLKPDREKKIQCDGNKLVLDFEENKDFFSDLIASLDEKRISFLFRYVTFEIEKYSSGEEALLKLYSRIFWLLQTNKIEKDILLLIDEVDLYMHPKWQRLLVDSIVEDVPTIMWKDGKKKSDGIQVILTTHSPIILSDIPKANTLFLKKKGGKCEVDFNENHKESFGNNVHTLFLDSFFLDEDGTVGEYAKKKINEVISILYQNERINDNDKELIEIINCIGDPIIRNKLQELYEKKNMQYRTEKRENFVNKETLNLTKEINGVIRLLKEQIYSLEEKIQKLEKAKND